MIAAIFVDPRGVYSTIDGIDCWGLPDRDARAYDGPWPVVAHPPCQRWGRYAEGGPNPRARRREIGDDDGCFASAFAAVRRFGGVLEHPAASHAWSRFGLPRPPSGGGWVPCIGGGWTCHVEQGHYGHRARKATWLYACHLQPPSLTWGTSAATERLEDGFHSSAARRAARAAGIPPRPRRSQRENEATPTEFAAVLVCMARSVEVQQ